MILDAIIRALCNAGRLHHQCFFSCGYRNCLTPLNGLDCVISYVALAADFPIADVLAGFG